MKINKSSRHSKITGDFTENLVLYLLSKHGFECANLDHTGIDLIARNPNNQDVMGISVKGRSRTKEAIGTSISIPTDNFEKVESACKAFNLKPYFAIVSDEVDKIHVFILSMEHLQKLSPSEKKIYTWKMDQKSISDYYDDAQILTFEFQENR